MRNAKRLFIRRIFLDRRFFGTLISAVVPTIFFLVSFQLTKVSGPTWLSNNFENNYPYLFNSLRLIKGAMPTWIDHPGTTTQIFGAGVLRMSATGSSDQIVAAVIDDPEKSIKQIQTWLLAFAAAALWVFPAVLALRIRSYVHGSLLQVPSLFFVTLLKYSTWFSSDLMLVPWCMAAFCLSVDLTRLRWVKASQIGPAVLAGIVCALGIFTKLTFFPIILIVFACCRGFRTRIVAAASFLLAAAVIAIPIYPRLAALADWGTKLASHTGGYGTGDAGFTRPDVLRHGASMLISNEPMILWLPVLSTIATLLLRSIPRTDISRTEEHPLGRTVLVLLILQVCGFFLVAKHPGLHYLIPLYLSTGLNLILVYEAVRRAKWPSISARVGAIALAVLLIWPLGWSFSRTTALFRSLAIWRKQQVGIYNRTKKLTQADLRIDYYRSSTPEFAAYFGNEYSLVDFDDNRKENYFGPLLDRRYPGAMFTLFFDSGMSFYTFTNTVDPADISTEHDHFYLFGNHSDGVYEKDHLMPIPGLDPRDIKEIDDGGYVYLDEWIRPTAAKR
jgi:hypothetical protein